MEENPEIKKKEKREELNQTKELQNLLNDMDSDSIPHLSSTAQTQSDIVSDPSFLSDKSQEVQPISPQVIAEFPIIPSLPDSTIKIDDIKSNKATGNYWKDVSIFFSQIADAYKSRYEFWGINYESILTILKKMHAFNEVNIKSMEGVLKEIEIKIKKGLKDFTMKRDEVERFSDIDYKKVSKSFKKTIELLNLQIREFKLQQSISELYDIYEK